MRTIRMAVLFTLALAALAANQAPAPSTTVLVGARLIDGTGAPPVENSLVVIQGDRIRNIATMPEPGTIPPDAERIDLRGKTILPGFVNAHGHVGDTNGLKAAPEFYTRENLERQLALYADYGITTVYSLGGDGPAGIALRDTRPPTGARLFVAGPVITATTASDATAAADDNLAMGVDWLKFRVDDNLGASEKMPKAVIERGHAKKVPVAAHIFYLEDAKDLLREGIDLIAHSVRDRPVDDEFISLAKARDVCVVPTLTREVSTFVYESTPAFASRWAPTPARPRGSRATSSTWSWR